ncbi:MAG: MerR family transcriptional regulator [Deltaproteobacteria bacterium]|nr:MerR family transcriptional regulator [Deltaproteobacteria bacterium]
MDGSIPDKSYFRIGEVSKILNVQPYVIRYWESEFKTVRPARTRSDQRLYRRRDVEELLTIKKLLYEENFTINGARKQLRKLRTEESLPASSVAVGDERSDLLAEIEKGLRQIRALVS